MSGAVRAVGAAVAAGGTGTWISVAGWPAAAAIGVAVLAGIALALFILASDAVTARAERIIGALRGPSAENDRRAPPPPR